VQASGLSFSLGQDAIRNVGKLSDSGHFGEEPNRLGLRSCSANKGHLLARKLVFGQSGNFLGAVASNLITKKCVDIERQRPADVKAGGVHDQGQAG
jgi:hypothetical protein